MSESKTRPVDESCGSYLDGHQVHLIQARKSWEVGQPELDVTVVEVHDDGRVDLTGDGVDATLWNHDPDRLRSTWDDWGRAAWRPRWHVLVIPGLFGRVLNMAAVEHQSPSVITEYPDDPHNVVTDDGMRSR